ncbi:hypothetical protein BH10PSE9_BH10PSE9_17700 [soil metagenome]
MKFEIVNCLSSQGDGAANEDAVGHAHTPAYTDFWVIDGATSVADQAYVAGETSDPAWFAQELSREIALACVERELRLDDVLRQAIGRVRDRYVEAVGGLASVPVYAWPLAALTIVRASRRDGRLVFTGRCLGDCPAFVSDGAWVPLWQPHTKGDQPAYLSENLDRVQLKERIRRRRSEQHAKPLMGVVVPDPDCVAYARHVHFEAGAAHLVLMSDGFARLFQEYGLTRAEDVMRQLERPGTAEGLIARLREAEQPGPADKRPLIYKNGDDATVIAVAFDGA